MQTDWRPNRTPDFDQFLRILERRRRPERLPFYEHIASPGFIRARIGPALDRAAPGSSEYWRLYVDFWLGMGYDEIPIEIPLDCPLQTHENRGARLSSGSESHVTIQTLEDFEQYPWPDTSNPIQFKHFEMAAQHLPEGAKLVAGVAAGPYEWVSQMMGVQGLALALYEQPALVHAMFERIGALHLSGVTQLATMRAVGALRQGDDLGFKTSTFLAPKHLRHHVFPIYTRMAQAAHRQNKPFILHSCGNLEHVYEDLIETCRIDAKHSFEDVILPVAEFKKQYGARVTPLGGLDVDKICQLPEDELRAYTRRTVEACFQDGFWALGTGNSLTDYMPVENYLVVLDEALKITA